MKIALQVLFAASAVLAACSSLDTSFDYDTSHDFGGLSTYAWIEGREATIDMKRVRDAVDGELASRGYRLVETRPDFQVAAHVSTADRLRIVDWGYTSHPRSRWHHGRDLDVWQYEEGTLVLDVIDPGQSSLVWRGTASKAINRSWTPEQRDAEARQAVQALLARFPPR